MSHLITYTTRFFILIALGVMLACCQKQEQQVNEQERTDVVNAWLSMNLNIVFSGDGTKAAENIEGGTNNGIDENAIKRLAIWVVPSDGGTENWEEAIMTYIPNVTLLSGNKYVASVRTKLNVDMNIYVAANISANIASKFLSGGPDAVYQATSNDYPQLVKEFASEEMGIAMFCTKKATTKFTDANITSSNPAIIDQNTDGTEDDIDLVRMLAKVHLLFECYDTHPDYVVITTPGSLTPAAYGEFGWSKLSEISYILNTVNKDTKLIQPLYGTGVYNDTYADNNHSMNDLLEKGMEWNYKSGAENKFLAFAEDLYADHDANWNLWAIKPEQFIENKAPFGTCTDGAYVNGLYCLENTSDYALKTSMSEDEQKYVPYMVATHIIVKARFVPRHIITGVDPYGDPITNTDPGEDGYDTALATLAEKKASDGAVDAKGNPTDYPQGTFFTMDMKSFYSYDGMIATMTAKGYTRKSFAEYPGGYGFYFSYIHGGTDPSTNQVTFDGNNSGVFRNHYHILNCSLLKVPAVPGSFNALMMVNSKVVDWNPKGALNIIVKPNS